MTEKTRWHDTVWFLLVGRAVFFLAIFGIVAFFRWVFGIGS